MTDGKYPEKAGTYKALAKMLVQSLEEYDAAESDWEKEFALKAMRIAAIMYHKAEREFGPVAEKV